MALLPDATAGAAISSEAFFPAWVAFLDIVGDPVRITSANANITFGSTGDSDLDGNTFLAIQSQFVDLSAAKNSEGGSETVTATLSGIVGPDTTLLNALGTKSNWQGRVARFWTVIYNPSGVQQGAVWNWYTGRMSAVKILGSPGDQTVQMDIEGYIASMRSASNRTYMDQDTFDPGDGSSAVKIAAANGPHKGADKANTAKYERIVSALGNVSQKNTGG